MNTQVTQRRFSLTQGRPRTSAPRVAQMRHGRRRAAGAMAAAAWLVLGPIAGCKPVGPTAPGARPAASAAAPRPGGENFNVLLVSVDTTRADVLGCYGNRAIATPNIDRMAREGARFEQCVSVAPMTLPSHATMITGSYPFVHGARENTAFRLGEKNETLGKILRRQGYYTFAEIAATIIGEKSGMNLGFDSFGDPENRQTYLKLKAAAMQELAEDMAAAPEGLDIDPMDRFKLPPAYASRVAQDIIDSGIEQIKKSVAQGKPFFGFLHCYDPHEPHEPPGEFRTEYDDGYLGEVAYFDEQFGRLLDALREMRLAEKTLVILTSDHGEGRWQHGESTHSYFLYDATQHVPLLLWCPGQIPPGVVVSAQVSGVDLAPTAVDFVRRPTTPQMQGVSLLDYVLNPGFDAKRAAYADTLAAHISFQYAIVRMLRQDGWKYIHAPTPELYHVAEDPEELINLARKQPDRVRQMRDAMRELIRTSPTPPDSAATVQTSRVAREQLRQLGYLPSENEEMIDTISEQSELDRFEPKGPNPRERIEVVALLTAAMGELMRGSPERGEELYRRLLKMEPDNARARRELGDCMFAQNKYKEALEAYRHAEKIDPDNVLLRSSMTTLLYLTGEMDQAEKQSRELLVKDPTNATAHYTLAQILAKRGEHEQALVHYGKAYEAQPTRLEILVREAISLRVLNRLDEAGQKAEAVLKVNPTLQRARAMVAAYYWDSKRHEEAVSTLEKGLELKPAHTYGMTRQLVQWYTEMGRHEDAVRHLRVLAGVDPTVAQTHYNLGNGLMLAGKYDEAIAAFQTALKLRAGYGRAALALVRCHALSGRRDEALEQGRILIEKHTELPDSFSVLAGLLVTNEKLSDAADVLRAGRKIHPKHVVLARDLAWLLATRLPADPRTALEAVETADAARQNVSAETPPEVAASTLDTLAVCQAAAGRFEEAVRTGMQAMKKAKELGNDALASRIGQRVEAFKKKQPYRPDKAT